MTPPDKQNSVSLNQILDQIEQRYKRCVVFGECHIKDDSVHADIFVDEARVDVPALVKALRRAVQQLEYIDPDTHGGSTAATLAEITQLLTEPEKEQTLEET